MSEQELAETPINVVNVYPLSPSFVNRFASHYSVENPSRSNPALDAQIANYEYVIGQGDILNITIWDHPELTIPAGSYRSAQEAGHWVHADGTIFYPYIGFVKVAGKTVTEVRTDISTRLAQYIESPQVDVNIAGFRSQKAYVTGEIRQPGYQPLTNVPLTFLDAINQAGGLTTDADWRNVTLTRNGTAETLSLHDLMQNGDLTENRLLQQGDIIHVPRNDAQKVFVLGEVQKPSLLKIDRSGMTLTEALSGVGGINELAANATGVFVFRSAQRDKEHEEYLAQVRDEALTKEQKQQLEAERQELAKQGKQPRPEKIVANVYQLDISDAAALVTGTEFELEPYDVVYVTAAPIEQYNRVVRQLLPTISALNDFSEFANRINNW
ncbi:sugar transporter [Vibrio breoganii]|uniref:Sugar transporter n=2 Tax=Vibrio breoganii TaxID=553239 RepID=A0AAN1CU74_9VIBR|nr:sugar transporter [Vibrio breoganii]OED98614.1 sugar transporter [Vibrio breoganii ZF-55]PMG75680.1 sugar transporter [Vibrio breoganii]PMK42645.1 sugar transporter [Vibrio breoganii]